LNRLFLLEVDVAFVTDSALRLVDRLSDSTRASKRVGASGCTHVVVFAFQSLGVEGDRPCLRVVSLGHALSQFVVSGFLSAAVHARLNNQLLVTLSHAHQLAVLSLHDLATDCVRSQVFLAEVLSLGGVEEALVALAFLRLCPLVHFPLHLLCYLFFHDLCLFAHARLGFFLQLARSVLAVVRRKKFRFQLSANAHRCVVERLSLNWVFEVKVPFGDVFLSHSPAFASAFAQYTFLLPISNESA